MIVLYLHRIFVLLVCQSLIFSPLVYADQLSLPADDLFAPEISHEAISDNVEEGASLPLRATVTDLTALNPSRCIIALSAVTIIKTSKCIEIRKAITTL